VEPEGAQGFFAFVADCHGTPGEQLTGFACTALINTPLQRGEGLAMVD